MKSADPKQSQTQDFLIEEFFNFLSVEKGLAHNTLQAYRQDLTSYKSFLMSKKIKDWSKIKREHILQYLTGEKKRGLDSPSIARRLVSIKLIHRFLLSEKYLEMDNRLRQVTIQYT